MKLREKRLDDGRWVTFYVELFGYASICVEDNIRAVEHNERDGGYDKYYQYPSVKKAYIAYEQFTDGDEPDGWIRAAPPRFRRRPNGDPSLEFIRE